jgi:hypothetical protein
MPTKVRDSSPRPDPPNPLKKGGSEHENRFQQPSLLPAISKSLCFIKVPLSKGDLGGSGLSDERDRFSTTNPTTTPNSKDVSSLLPSPSDEPLPNRLEPASDPHFHH